MVVALTVPVPPLAKTSAIYASGNMTYNGTGGSAPVAIQMDHEEQFDPAAVPSQTTAGMIAVILALLAGGGLMLRKRRSLLIRA